MIGIFEKNQLSVFKKIKKQKNAC